MTAGRANYLRQGDYNAICEVCGQRWKASQIRQRWDGLFVCPNDFEIRNPQDFVTAVPDPIAPPWIRPRQPGTFIEFCSLADQTGIAGIGVAGCMVPGRFPDTELPYETPPACTLSGTYAIAGTAIASCAIAGNLPLVP